MLRRKSVKKELDNYYIYTVILIGILIWGQMSNRLFGIFKAKL